MTNQIEKKNSKPHQIDHVYVSNEFPLIT